MAKILTVGSSDIIVNTDFDNMPRADSKTQGKNYSLSLGGSAVISALTASKLGMSAAVCSRIGEDTLGTSFIRSFKKNNIIQNYLIQDKSKRTGLLLCLNESGMSEKRIYFEGANSSMTSEDVMYASDECPDALIIDTSVPINAFRDIISEINRQSAKVVINATNIENVSNISYADKCDVLILSQQSVSMLTTVPYTSETNKLKISKELLKIIDYNYLIIIQENGVAFVSEKLHYYFSSQFESEKKDTLYSTDVFSGVLTTLLTVGKDIMICCNYALAAVALYESKEGTVKAIPSLEEIKLKVLSNRS